MDFLKAEISRKKNILEDKKIMGDNAKRFFKRGDLVAKEREEYLAKLPKNESTKVTQPTSTPECSDIKIPPREHIVKRLRDHHEPIRLFGETDFDSFRRLQKIDSLHSTTVHEQSSSNKRGINLDVKEDCVEFVIDDLRAVSKTLNSCRGSPTSKELVVNFFVLMLFLWARELNSRSTEEKQSAAGKMDSARHRQTYEYIQPLLTKLRRDTLDQSILENVISIVRSMLKGEYKAAHDTYLQMSIGNAPWPIGVTSHGINKRPGNDKIATKNIANVLNDECQRKYIQAAKRLMTICQRMYPVDPSKSFEYTAQ